MKVIQGVFIVAGGLMTVAACRTLAPSPPATVPEYPTEEAVSVYRAVLTSVYSGPERPSVIVVWDSLMHGLTRTERLLALPDAPAESTAEAFRRETTIPFSSMRLGPHQFGAFPRDVPSDIPILFHSTADFARIQGRGAIALDSLKKAQVPIEIPAWLDFAEAYPGAWGLDAFTPVGFNDSQTEAIVELTHGCGGSCRSFESFVLRKSGSTWSVVHRIVDPSQSTDGAGFGALRYAAPGGVAHAIATRERDSIAAARADSTKLASTPRQLRGTVTHSSSGRPVVNANILTFVATGWGPATRTDTSGRFHFGGVALGGSVFVVCPGREPDPDKWLGGGSFDLAASADTTLAIRVNSIARCWNSRRARPLSPGILESSIFRSSQFPDSLESAVYLAAIGHLYPSGHSRPLLRAFAIPGCEFSDSACGVPVLPLLVREGAIDSTALSNFRIPPSVPAPFSLRFGRNAGLHLFTPDEENYFAKEAIAADREKSIQDSAGHFFRTVRQVHEAAPSIVSFGRVAFDAANRTALVRIRTEAGGWTNVVETLLLRRTRSGWRVARQGLEKDAVSGEMSGGECVPVRPPASVGGKPTDLIGDYSVRFISTTGTRQRGDSLMVRIEQSGTSRRVFQVIDPVSGARDARMDGAISIGLGKAAVERKSNFIVTHPPGPHMEIRHIGSGAFAGSWRSGSHGVPVDRDGNRLPSAAGYFCARPVPQGAAP